MKYYIVDETALETAGTDFDAVHFLAYATADGLNEALHKANQAQQDAGLEHVVVFDPEGGK